MMARLTAAHAWVFFVGLAWLGASLVGFMTGATPFSPTNLSAVVVVGLGFLAVGFVVFRRR